MLLQPEIEELEDVEEISLHGDEVQVRHQECWTSGLFYIWVLLTKMFVYTATFVNSISGKVILFF